MPITQFRNLVFEGGRVKGIAYAGAIQTDFGLTPAQIKTLIANGVQGATAYLKWFSNPKAKLKPLN